MRSLRFWFGVVLAAAATWTWTVVSQDVNVYDVLARWWPASVTMILGAFIAGASAEGGGAIAYPVFTLLLKIPPDAARNFSFMIQSVGMVSASALILGRKIPIESRAVVYSSLGGLLGFGTGTVAVVPYIEPIHAKLFFVSLWLAFGIGLWRINRNPHRVVAERLPEVLQRADIAILVSTGLIGGIITAVIGNGIDIFTFCVLTLWYGLSERVATPTSVVLMSVLTLAGTITHGAITRSLGSTEVHAWIAAAPVVIIMAPLGAWVASKLLRLHIAYLLQGIILIQFVGALYVLQPTVEHIVFCGAVTLLGTLLMLRIDRTSR